MDYFLADATSLKVLRTARATDSLSLEPCPDWPGRASLSAPRMRDLPALRSALPPRLLEAQGRAAIDLTYFSRQARPTTAGINARTLLSAQPSDAFVELRELGNDLGDRLGVGIFLESPGLTFVRMAQRLTHATKQGKLSTMAATIRLVGFGMELCGSYARDPGNPIKGPCTYGLEPVCRVSHLKEFTQRATGMCGVKLARSAAEFVRDDSGSPAETLLALAMALPPRLGGAGLPDFVQNQPLAFDGQPDGLIHHRTMRPDFYWPLHHVAGEYNGKVHDSEKSHEEDHFRRQDYATLGISLLEARYSDIKDACNLERFLKLVALKLEPAEAPGFIRKVDLALSRPEAHGARMVLVSQLSAGIGDTHS